MPSQSLTGFLQGFTQTSVGLLQLRQAKEAQDARMGREKELLDLRRKEFQGREAQQKLKEQQIMQALKQQAAEFARKQATNKATGQLFLERFRGQQATAGTTPSAPGTGGPLRTGASQPAQTPASLPGGTLIPTAGIPQDPAQSAPRLPQGVASVITRAIDSGADIQSLMKQLPSAFTRTPEQQQLHAILRETGPVEPDQSPLGVLTQEMASIDAKLQKVQALFPSKEANLANDNLQARLNSLRQRRLDLIKEIRAPFDKRLAVRKAISSESAFKDLSGARQAFGIIQAGANRKSNAGDLAIINGFARMLDPGSVVRPAEFETVRRIRPVLARLEGFEAKVLRGEQLTPKERVELLGTAKDILGEYEATVRKDIGTSYRSILRGSGVTLDEIFRVPPAPGFSVKEVP